MDEAKRFCDELCDELFDSIDASSALEPIEKRLLTALWRECTVRSQCVERYPGDAAFAKYARLTLSRTRDTLEALARKGFLKPVCDGSGTVSRIRLNALMLEAAFDAAKRSRLNRRNRPDAA